MFVRLHGLIQIKSDLLIKKTLWIMKTEFMKLTFVFLLFSFGLSAQTITGKVTSIDGETLPGVNIFVKGTTIGTNTDIDGNYSLSASDGDIIVFSYVGMLPKEMTVSGSVMDVQMTEDATTLSDVVVTATRQPIRKIQTTTAISSIGAEELKSSQAESFGEAIQSTPGVSSDNSQGRKSSFNIRGFPSGNTYVTTLMDGLPLSGFASRSAGVAEYHGLDKNVERIEVVRGSGATLFGRAAGAGAVNIITKTGGKEFGGSVAITRFNNVVGDDHRFSGDLDYRLDLNLNGPISDKLRYNIGGYIIQDSGYKEWAIKDKGTQLRANLDYLINEKSKIRVYAMYGNNQFNNLTDSPYDLGAQSLPEGWENFNTFYSDNSQLDFADTLYTSVFSPFATRINDVDGNPIVQNQVEDNREEVIGGHFGISGDFDIGDGWSFSSKFRIQSFDWRDHNEITFSSFYTTESNLLRLNANSIGQIEDIVFENRIQKKIIAGKSEHNISFGQYYSAAEYDRFGGLHWYQSNVDPAPTYSWFGGSPPPRRFSLSSTTSNQTEAVTSFFAGDEMVFNEKLRVNVGVRYDRMTGSFNNNPNKIKDIDFEPDAITSNSLSFSDFSASLGVNYMLNERSAFYGSILRAFSLPSIGLATEIPTDNEIVFNTEIGYRAGFGDLGVDVALFNTSISNRLATVFDPQAVGGQTFVVRPVGNNVVRGAEIQLTYAPQSIKGLLLRTSVTLQQSEYAKGKDGRGLEIPLDNIDDDGDPATPRVPEADIDNLFGLNLVTLDASQNLYAIDVTGNQVHNTPTFLFSFNAAYNHKFFGVAFDMLHYAGRYATSLNLYETPDFTTMNANIFGKINVGGNDLRLGIRVKNLLDSANPQQVVLGSTNDNVLVQKQATPDFTDVLGFGVIQLPRRILITLSYDF